jgi:hypothetical protein
MFSLSLATRRSHLSFLVRSHNHKNICWNFFQLFVVSRFIAGYLTLALLTAFHLNTACCEGVEYYYLRTPNKNNFFEVIAIGR